MSIVAWLRRLTGRRLDDDDFKEEIRAHLAIAEDEHVADGTDRQAAHYAALKEFGNVTLTTEAARRVWIPWWLEVLWDLTSDVRYAIRALAKNQAFSLTVVGVLTLGIGLNAAVFTILKSLALTPIAGADGSARLAVVFGETSAGRQVRVSYPDYQYLRDHHRAFSGVFGSALATVNLGRGRSARQIWGELVTGNYFQVLGVRAGRGRTLLPSDEVAPGRHPSFHGTTVVYDVEVFIPVMMAPELGFRFGSQQTTPSGVFSDRRASVFYPQGYLRPGTTLANAAAETEALWAVLSRDRPGTDAAARLRVVRFWQTPHGAPIIVLPTLIVLIAMGLLVLLIACSNIAGLVLVRGVSRRGEIAVRLALGATRTRIVRLLIVENLVLAVPGALLGILLARRVIPVLVGYAEWLAAPERIFFNIELDSLVIGFAALVACGSALLFGFVPALQSSRVDLVSVINADASPRGAARGRLRAGLVVAQVAVSLLLLVGAGLVMRSLEAARGANPGFDQHHVTTLAVDVKQNAYDESHGRVFYRQLLDTARADPEIESATLAAYNPLAFLETRPERVTIESYEPRRGEDVSFMSNTIGPDYFRTLRIPLMAGRAFEDRDDETAAPVAVVNSTLAQRFWGSAAHAIGKRIRVALSTGSGQAPSTGSGQALSTSSGQAPWRTVIGVAADVKYFRINEAPRPYVYLPFLQSYRSSMILYTRGSSVPGASSRAKSRDDRLVDQARACVAALDADLPILYARPMADTTRGALILFDLSAAMLFLFGVAGMALAAMGTYGLVSYTVKQSTHEIGIRMALGASGLSVVRMFLGRGLRLGAIGAALGIVAAFGLTRLLGSVLFGVSTTDAISFTRALAVVLGVVVVATLVPAWRASRIDPLTALRHQ
jgi:putative ABC transport system permease protein